MPAGHVITLPDFGIRIGDTWTDDIVLTGLRGLGKTEQRVADRDRPREDGEFLGRDRLKGRLLTLAGEVSTHSRDSALEVWRRLQRAWDAPAVRGVPGATTAMTLSMFGGQEWTVFGRPRALDPLDEGGFDQLHQGLIRWVATFKAVDHLFYGAERSTTVGIVSAASSGTKFPLRFPLRFARRVTSRAGQIEVDGDADAWPVVTVFGPILRPRVELVDGWFIELGANLAYDRYITINTAPWARSVLLDGAINAAPLVTASSRRPAAARLPPGPHEVLLRGTDPTGSASMAFSWRPASRSI